MHIGVRNHILCSMESIVECSNTWKKNEIKEWVFIGIYTTSPTSPIMLGGT